MKGCSCKGLQAAVCLRISFLLFALCSNDESWCGFKTLKKNKQKVHPRGNSLTKLLRNHDSEEAEFLQAAQGLWGNVSFSVNLSRVDWKHKQTRVSVILSDGLRTTDVRRLLNSEAAPLPSSVKNFSTGETNWLISSSSSLLISG